MPGGDNNPGAGGEVKPPPDYRLEELKFIRQRVSELSTNIKDYEIYYVGTIGAVYGFMFLYAEKISRNYAILISVIPIFLSVYAGLKTKSIFYAIRIHDLYIHEKIESAFGGEFVKYYYGKYRTSSPYHMTIRYVFWFCATIFGLVMMFAIACAWNVAPSGALQIKLELKL